MRNADDDELRRRLTAALDAMRPPYSAPRYAAARRRSLAWRLAPAVLAVTALSGLVLSAYAGTGSPNPVVWTEKVVNVVQPPAPPPIPEQTQPARQKSPSPKAAAPSSAPSHHESPEAAQSPEPRESPEPTDDHEQAPSATPSPGTSPGTSTTTTSDSGDAERS
jgi:outer membrane biosynthesis protein TonB